MTSTSLFSFCIDADFFSLPSVSLYSFKIKQTLSPTYAHHFPAAPACLIIKYVSERVFFIFRRTLVIQLKVMTCHFRIGTEMLSSSVTPITKSIPFFLSVALPFVVSFLLNSIKKDAILPTKSRLNTHCVHNIKLNLNSF